MHKKTLLLVNKKDVFENIRNDVLKDAGFETLHAQDETEAISIIKNKKDKIDLILMAKTPENSKENFQAAQSLLKENKIPLYYYSELEEDKKILPIEDSISDLNSNDEQVRKELLNSLQTILNLKKDKKKKHVTKNGTNNLSNNFELLNILNESICIIKNDKYIAYANEGTLKMYRYNKDEIIGKHIELLTAYNENNPENINDKMDKVLKTGKPDYMELWCKRKNNEIFRTEVNLSRTNYLNKNAIVFAAREISRQKDFELLLKESKDGYRSLVNNIDEILFQTDAYGYWTFLNKVWTEVTGFSVEESIGRLFLDFVFPDDREYNVKKFRPLIERKKEFCRHQVRYLTVDGSYKWTEVHARLILDENNNAIGTTGTLTDITERKKIEDERKQNNSLLRATLESTADGILVVDNYGNISDFNKKFIEIWNIPNDITVSRDDQKAIQFVLDQLINPQSFEYKVNELYHSPKKESLDFLKFKDGRIIERYSRPQMIEGETVGRVWSFRDITERKKAEDSLQKSEERYRAIIENQIDGIVVVDSNEYFKFANPAAEKIFGVLKNGLINRNLAEFVSVNQMILINNETQKRKNGENSTYEIKIKRSDGEKRYLQISSSPQKDKDENFIGTFGIIRDITKLKQAEEKNKNHIKEITNLYETAHDLAELQTDLNSLLQNIVNRATALLKRTDGGMYLYDRETGDLIVTAATNPLKPIGYRVKIGEGMTGRVAQTRRPMIIDDYFNWEHRLPVYENSEIKSVIEVPMLYQGDLIGVLAIEEFGENAEKFTDSDMRLLTIFAGQAAGVVHNARLFKDLELKNRELHQQINIRKETEIKLQRYTKELQVSNATKDKFFSIIAHDLRSPYLGLKGYSEILLNEFESLKKKEIKNYISIISNSINRQFEFLTDLLEWARVQTGKFIPQPERILLRDNVSKVIETFSLSINQKNINIINKIDDTIKIFSDKDLLNLVLRNLLSNAIKFTYKNGSIIVSCESKNNIVEISVADNGVGISKENMDKIFRIDVPHSTEGTAKEKGTGLGLILCKEIIEKNGSKIWVESEKSKGSIFTFTLPVSS